MLDTNICIYIIKKQPEKVVNKFKNFLIGDICVSSITLAELTYGVEKSQYYEKNKAALEEFLLPLDILHFDHNAALHYGAIRTHLEKKGTPIGPLDLLIAAHARSTNCILVTNNKKEFLRVSDLLIEDWSRSN
jgi:tRNA(fMet)-specific endonuclease VapC